MGAPMILKNASLALVTSIIVINQTITETCLQGVPWGPEDGYMNCLQRNKRETATYQWGPYGTPSPDIGPIWQPVVF